MKYLTSKW